MNRNIRSDRPLSAQQLAFVAEYLRNGMRAREAYITAYPRAGGWKNKHSADASASNLLKNEKIQAIVEEARGKTAELLSRETDRFAVTKASISRELARMAFADHRRLFRWTEKGVEVIPSDTLSDDDAAAVVEVSHTVTESGGTIRVRLGDKRQALMDLAKLHGHIVDRKDVRVIRNVEDLTDEELAALAGDVGADRGRGTRH